MPIYEYECEACHGRFEFMQSVKDAPKTACETCGGRLNKMMSASGFILKGGGWYKDLYASPKAGNKEKSADGAGPSDAKASASTDSKPAPPSDKSAAPASPKKGE